LWMAQSRNVVNEENIRRLDLRRWPAGRHASERELSNQLPPCRGIRTSGRHAAITNNLNNWSSYRSWVEKIRGTWEDRK
jgi:hypothetical protein